MGPREGPRKGAREGPREGAREGPREGAREGPREGPREGGPLAGLQFRRGCAKIEARGSPP